MTRIEQTLDGKLLPRHLNMFRDEDSGRIELHYWRFQPILLFLIPFMAVWSGGSLFGCCILPFLRGDLRDIPLVYGASDTVSQFCGIMLSCECLVRTCRTVSVTKSAVCRIVRSS